MTNTTPSYGDLPVEDTWIEYLRTRLPYSFNCIEEKVSGRSRHFVLSEPIQELAIHRQGVGGVKRLSMMRIMARRTKATTVLA